MLGPKKQGGFTLVEVAIIILTLAILSAILVPQLGRLNALARFVKVKEDLMVLCSAMKMYLDDTGESQFFADGHENTRNTPERDGAIIGLLVGDGDIPDAGLTGGDWRNAVSTSPSFSVTSDLGNKTVSFVVDTFANHLIQNSPLDNNADRRYRVPQDMEDDDAGTGLNFDPVDGEGFNSLFAWRGPYINDRVYPDPWGNRYASNVFALHTPDQDGSIGYASAVVCYSAGADEEVDTAFNQPDGWTTGDDDQTVILNSGGW